MSMNGLQVVNDESKPYVQSEEAFAEEDPELLVLPAVWTHHATGHKAFMVHSRCMWHMELADGTRLSIDESREVCISVVTPLLPTALPFSLTTSRGAPCITMNLTADLHIVWLLTGCCRFSSG